MGIQMSRILIALGVAYLMLAGGGSGAAASTHADELGSLGMIIEIYDESDGLVLEHRKGRTSQNEPICVNEDYRVEVWAVAFLIWNNIESDNALVVRGEWRVEAGGQDITPPEATGGRLENVGNRVTQAAIFSYKPTEKGLDSLIFRAPQVRHPETRVVQSVREVVTLKVEDCPLNTSMIYQGSFEGEGFAVNLFGVMDEVMLNANDDGTYSGSGTSVLTYIVHLDSPTCSMFLEQDVSQVDMTATVTEQVITLVFDPQPGVWHRLVSCPRFGEIGGFSLLDIGLPPVTLPGSGGVVRLPPVLFPGYFTIIVTRETGEGAVSDAGVRLPSKATGLDQAALSE